MSKVLPQVDRKNYSFFMPVEFDKFLSIVQNSSERYKALSKSQAVYFIIAELADKITQKES